APVVRQGAGVGGRVATARRLLIASGSGERQRQAADVVEEVAHGPAGVRGRTVELVVADAAHERREGGGGRAEVESGHAGPDPAAAPDSSVPAPALASIRCPTTATCAR